MTADENTRNPKKGTHFYCVSGTIMKQHHATAHRILEHFSRFGSYTTPQHIVFWSTFHDLGAKMDVGKQRTDTQERKNRARWRARLPAGFTLI